MKKLLITCTILFVLTQNHIHSQVVTNGNNFLVAQSFSKEIALFYAKSFLFKDVLGSTTDIVKFEVIPLASAVSGELTTLIYKCESKSKEGMILGFYGDYWNEAGVVYKGFSFKNLNKDQAIEFLNKIQITIDENSKYLSEDSDNNNVYFRYDDIDILIYDSNNTHKLRLFWNGFDSTWENTSFERSKKRFEKRIK